jgi:hypothetical protein
VKGCQCAPGYHASGRPARPAAGSCGWWTGRGRASSKGWSATSRCSGRPMSARARATALPRWTGVGPRPGGTHAALARVVCRAGLETSFAQASDLLDKMLGVAVPSDAVRRVTARGGGGRGGAAGRPRSGAAGAGAAGRRGAAVLVVEAVLTSPARRPAPAWPRPRPSRRVPVRRPPHPHARPAEPAPVAALSPPHRPAPLASFEDRARTLCLTALLTKSRRTPTHGNWPR